MLREAIALVPQQPTIFASSARDNIRYGRLEASDKEVVEAARKAHAHEFIAQIREGYDSLVGERGVKLSGGQRQRIGVARALAADPPIILLDEPFGALDPITRRDLQQEFRALQRRLNKTMVFVTHDVREALLLANRIGLLKDGKLILLGGQADLLNSADPEAQAFAACARDGQSPGTAS